MYVVDRISAWSMGVGVQQLSLSEADGFKFADHIRHLHHHLKALNGQYLWSSRGLSNVETAKHLIACSRVLSKIAFEASLIPLDIDYDELEDIQHQISLTLKTLENDNDIISLPGSDSAVLEVPGSPD